MDSQRVYSLLLICILATVGSVACTPSGELVSSPTIVPSEPPPTATHTPGPTPWLNAQGVETIVDDREHIMARIPAGAFVMGATDAQIEELCSLWPFGCGDTIPPGLESMQPAHEVTLTHDYWMDVYEVTNAQYQACVEGGICEARLSRQQTKSASRESYYGNLQYADYPVVIINWHEANTFCQEWRGGRLPTEAEWEYAARGTDGRLWPWGNNYPNYDLLHYLDYETASEGYRGDTGEIGIFPEGVSPFGLHDMAGNAMEWVADWFGSYPNEPVIDPTGSVDASEGVLRGGSFFDGPIETSTIYRYPNRLDKPLLTSGFRCIVDISQ